VVRFHVDRGRHKRRNAAIGAYVAALAVVGVTAAGTGVNFYTQGPMVLVGILVLVGAMFHAWYWSLSWSRHPVLLALETRPSEVVRAQVVAARGKAALANVREVVVGTETASLVLTIDLNSLEGLGEALQSHCSEITLAGFPSC